MNPMTADQATSPALLFDAHLDLAWNALEFNRDLRRPLAEIRRRESGLAEKSRGRSTVCFPEMRRGGIGLCVATLLARCAPVAAFFTGSDRVPSFHSQEQAWAAIEGQRAWYAEMETCGELTPIRTAMELDAHLGRWKSASAPSPECRPIGYVLSMENADPLVSSRHLDRAHANGVRAIGPVHYGPGIFGHGTDDEGPLTPRGRELLAGMRRLGIILDVTHLCRESFWDALRRFDGPTWASHSNCRTLADWNRQFDDGQLRALIERGSVIGVACDAVMLVHGYVIGRSRPSDFGLKLERLCEHIDHICQVAGNAEHVGIGSDLDGGFGTEQTPTDLDRISDLARIRPLLAARGFRSDDIERVLGGNFVSFLRRAWA